MNIPLLFVHSVLILCLTGRVSAFDELKSQDLVGPIEPLITTSPEAPQEVEAARYVSATEAVDATNTTDVSAILAELTALKNRLEQLEGGIRPTTFISSESSMTANGGYVCDSCCGNECSANWQSQFSFQTDVLFLRPSISGINPVFNVSPAADEFLNPSFDAALRHKIEYWPQQSFGIRGQYFHYDHDTPFEAPFQPAEFGIDLDTVDLEAVIRQQAGRWQLDFSAGVEYGRLNYATSTATAVGVGSVRFEGVGPVVGLNGKHSLGSSRFSLYGGLRGAFLFGNINNASLLVNVPRSKIRDEMTQIYSTQLGLSWEPDLIENGSFVVRAGWDAQFWLNETLSDDSFGIGSNLGLTGPTVGVELTY